MKRAALLILMFVATALFAQLMQIPGNVEVTGDIEIAGANHLQINGSVANDCISNNFANVLFYDTDCDDVLDAGEDSLNVDDDVPESADLTAIDTAAELDAIVADKNLCLSDGTNCPPGGGGTAGVSAVWSGSTSSTTLTNSATRYFPISFALAPAAGFTNALWTLAPAAGLTPTRFTCYTDTTPAGAATWTFTLANNVGDTNWTCTVNSSTNPCTDLSGSAIAFSYVAVKSVPATTPTASVAACTLLFSTS